MKLFGIRCFAFLQVLLTSTLLGCGGDGSTSVSINTLFSDDFSAGLSKWTTNLSGTDSFDGNPAPSIHPVNLGNEAVSTTTFNFTGGLTLQADMKAFDSGGTATIWFGLDTASSPDATLSLSAGIFLNASSGNRQYHVNGSSSFSEPGSNGLWESYKIVIRADGFVEFYHNDVLKHTSSAAINAGFNNRPLSIGGEQASSPGGWVDNVTVTQ